MPLYYAIAGSAALVIAIMLALNGELTAVYGEYLTTFIIHAVGLVSVSAVSLVKRENPIKMAKGVPFAILLGGVINYFTTFFNTLAVGKISVTAILALSLLGQAVTSLVVDCFGLMGMPRRRLGALELCGLAITAGGIVLLLGGTGSAPLLPVIVSILSGTCCVCTRQVTAQLSERTSLLTGTWFSYFTGLLVSVAALGIAAALGVEIPFSAGFSPRAWIYLGGALGAVAVFLQSICVKHMSSVAMTLVMFAGQVFGGTAIDALFYEKFSTVTLTGGILAFAGLVLNALGARARRSAHLPNETSVSLSRSSSRALSACFSSMVLASASSSAPRQNTSQKVSVCTTLPQVREAQSIARLNTCSKLPYGRQNCLSPLR